MERRELRVRKIDFLCELKPAKQLITPYIKKQLKGWLVRRRNHPYPNKREKREIAKELGLTYMQVCNWFANWRRKLKHDNQLLLEEGDETEGSREESDCSERIGKEEWEAAEALAILSNGICL